MATSFEKTAWSDLPVKYVTDKVPPGWFVGCNWEFRKYRDACNEWRVLAFATPDKQKVVALRFRLKGTAYDTAMAAPRPVQLPMTEEGDLPEIADNEFWRLHWEHMDKNYLDDEQAWNMKLFDQFFEYSRKAGVNVRDFIAEAALRYSEARTAGLDLGSVAKSYQFIKAARFNDEQKRWVLTPVQNDLSQYDDIIKSALKMPDAMAKHVHIVRYDDDGNEYEENDPRNDEDGNFGIMYQANEEDQYTDDEWSDFLAYWMEVASVWFADEDNSDDWATDENGEIYYNDDECEEVDIPDEFGVFTVEADEADTEDDEQACGVFLQHRKNKRKLNKSRNTKWGDKREKSGFGRKFNSFRRFKGPSKGKGWNSGFQRPGAWLKGAGKGKTGSGKGFGKSFGKGKSKGSPKGFNFGKGFGNSKGYGKSSGKGKTGKKGQYQQNDGFYSPYKRGW